MQIRHLGKYLILGMENTILALESLLNEREKDLRKLDENLILESPAPGKWSKKQIMGHLVDSALNNARRFVAGQYEHMPQITYNQDQWVGISHYQEYPFGQLVTLFIAINRHIIHILRFTTPAGRDRLVKTQQEHTIEWLAADYLKHLRHHLHQVLDLEPVAYP